MQELFPHLKGLKSGLKQHWIDTNLDTISMLSEHLTFDDLCQVLHSKPETVVKALKKAEMKHRPAITQAERAKMIALNAESIAYTNRAELSIHAEAISELSNDFSDTKEMIIQWHEMQSRLHTMMVKSLSSRGRASYFTEHIANRNIRKVGLTARKGSVRLSISNKVGLTTSRLIHFSDRGSQTLPRQGVKGVSKHRSHFHERRRQRDV